MEIAAVVAVLFAATLVRTVVGFGDALLAMPVLGLLLGLPVATGLVGLVSIPIAVGILAGSWRSAQLTDVRWLLAGTAAGVPLGVLLLTRAPEQLVLRLLGVVLLAFVAWRLVPGAARGHVALGWAVPAGVAGGCLGGAFNVAGPPLVLYLTLRHLTPAQFRATFQAFSLPSSVLIVLGQGASGLWTTRVFVLFAASLPAIGLAVLLGGRLHERVPPERFEKAVLALIGTFGALLLVPR